MIERHLEEAGFTATESKIYTALVSYGRLTPARLAEIVGIKRTTVYAALHELVKKGVIAEELRSKTKRFTALTPDLLYRYIEQQKRDIDRQESALEKAIAEIQQLPKDQGVQQAPKIRYIAQRDMLDFLYAQTPIWEESMKKTKQSTWWGFQDHTFVETPEYVDWVLWYWKRAPKGVDLKLVSNDSEVEQQMGQHNLAHRDVRFWPESDPITATQWILGEYIISVVTNIQPHYLIQIHDPIMAHNQRALFKKIWKDYFERK
jgi:sugar-specific transcriptional regulator TrmB